MIKSKANQKHSYTIMKLDYMLDKYRDYETIDLEEMHIFVSCFNLLPRTKQQQYGWMLDEAANLWDSEEQPEY
jgi:hypothetical protein